MSREALILAQKAPEAIAEALQQHAPAVTGLSQEMYDALVRDAMLWRTHECEVGL